MNSDARSWWKRRVLLATNLAVPITLLATRFEFGWLNALGLLIHAGFFYAVAAPGCDWFGPVVTRFRPLGNDLWLTIDDGPAGAETQRLGEELARRGAPATFFFKGMNLERQPGIASPLFAAGHALANHTQTHPAHKFWWLFPRGLRNEIDDCNAALRAAGAGTQALFRPPVGLKHILLHPMLAARGMRCIAWSVRGRDGVRCVPEKVARRVARQARPGSIVLLHEGRERSNEAILRVVDEMQARGFSFVIPTEDQLV